MDFQQLSYGIDPASREKALAIVENFRFATPGVYEKTGTMLPAFTLKKSVPDMGIVDFGIVLG
jgi:hypothetical protein